jgi:hypothetical protein
MRCRNYDHPILCNFISLVSVKKKIFKNWFDTGISKECYRESLWALQFMFVFKHLFKLGFTDDPTCERCLQEDESATHIICDCEAIAYIRFRHLGQFFMELSDFYDAFIIKVLHFIRSVGLIKC